MYKRNAGLRKVSWFLHGLAVLWRTSLGYPTSCGALPPQRHLILCLLSKQSIKQCVEVSRRKSAHRKQVLARAVEVRENMHKHKPPCFRSRLVSRWFLRLSTLIRASPARYSLKNELVEVDLRLLYAYTTSMSPGLLYQSSGSTSAKEDSFSSSASQTTDSANEGRTHTTNEDDIPSFIRNREERRSRRTRR